MAYAVAAYKNHLTVSADGRSYVIDLQFRSHDPELASRVLNKHIDLYLADQVAFKREVGTQASEWLSEEIPKLEARLRASQDTAQRFREENNIIMAGGTTLLSQQLAAVNAQLPPAAQERVNRETLLQRARELLRRGAVESEADILGSKTIERLRDQEAAILRKQGELSTTYGPRHPAVAKVSGELDDLRRAIAAEAGRIVKSLENDVSVAGQRERELRQRLADLERQSVIADRAEAKLHDLEREVAANQSLLETLSTRYKQVGAQEGAQVPDARIIANASIPIAPSFPKPHIVLPASLSIGMLLGMAVAFCRELTARGFRGSQEVESEFALPSLGSVPIIPRDGMRRRRPEDCVIERPRSAFAEAIRYIRNSIQMVPPDIETPRVFLVTSSLPNEGKSVLAISLARSFARSGKRTLLVDCDLRNPSICRLLGAPEPTDDLSSLTADTATFDQVVQSDPRSKLDFIAAKKSEFEPQDMLSSRYVSQLLGQCAQLYDVVIMDSPPITAVSDALILARHADATILAVRWGRTPRDIARASLNKLFTNGARLCGAVLTQVDIDNGVFSPREPEYYQKLNRSYYSG
jgi:capsular exopolysaccharide synthesis family protein